MVAAASYIVPSLPSRRAVVLGASLAGLLAARVLSDCFGDVLLLERDELPADAAPRKGTPHAVHPHGLLARGLEVLETLLPGFTRAMQERGGLVGDMMADVAFEAGRQRFAPGRAGLPALAASRLAIEAEVRARVLARPGVRAITGVQVLAPRHAQGRVIAARWRSLADEIEHVLDADLIVDCTGRGSQLPRWLGDWGYDPPVEDRVDIGICYTSAFFKRAGGCAIGPALEKVATFGAVTFSSAGPIAKVATFGAVTNAQPRPAVVIAQEPAGDGMPRWVVGVGGFRGDHAGATLGALRARALDIASPELVKITQEGELIGEVMRYQMPHSQRRRYERMKRLPEGMLAMGDAITSFNPIYGQGMTVAACEALALQRELSCGIAGIGPRFFRSVAKVIDTPWQLAVGGDLSIDAVPGPRPLAVRLVNAYMARLYRVAPQDPVVSLAFQRVVHMVDPPASVLAPRMLWRVLRHRGAAAEPASAAARSASPRPGMP